MRLQLLWLYYWRALFLLVSLQGFILPRWSSARVRTSLFSSKGPQAETVETLWRLPNSPVSVKSTVSFLHSWGRETATTGAVRCTTTPKGVAFAFSPIPGSVLELTVATDKGSEYELGLDVRIVSRLLIPSFPRASAAATGSPAAKEELKAQQMQSLVRFAARSIIDSFNSEVADLISSPPPAPESSDSAIAVIDEDDVDLEKLKAVKQWPGSDSSASINIDTAELQRRLGEAWVVPEPGDEPTLGSRRDDNDEDNEDEQERKNEERGKPERGNVLKVTAEQTASEARHLKENVEEGDGDEDGAWGSAATSIEGDLDALVPFLRSRASADGNSGDSLRRQLKAMQNQKIPEPEPSSRQTERPVGKSETSKRGKGGFVDFAEPAVSPGLGLGDMAVPGVDAAGLNLDKFKGRGVEEQALEELDRLVANSRKEGFAQVLAALPAVNVTVDAKVRRGERYREGDATVPESEEDRDVVLTPTQSLLRQGKSLSKASVQALLSRPPVEPEDLSIPVTKFPVNLAAGGLSGGIDIFEGPPVDPAWVPASSVLGQQLAAGVEPGAVLGAGTEVSSLAALEAALGTKVQNPATLRRDTNSLELLVTDLTRLPAEMHDDVFEAFRDLLLSDNFLFLLKAANATVSDGGSRRALGRIATRSSELTLELGLLVRTESVRHLETISDICEVAALYQEDEGEFLDRLDIIRPRFDSDLLGYLKFAIAEEEQFIAARGSDATRFPTQWLQILRVVQQGVRADVERRFDRLLDPILLALRFTEPLVQERLFSSFVNNTASLDLYYMRNLCCNLVAGMGDSVRTGEFDKAIVKFKQPSPSAGGKQSTQRVSPEGRRMLAHIKRFNGLVEKYLSEAVVDRRFKELELEAAEQGQEIVRRHRNILVQQQIDFAEEREQQEMRIQSGESLLDRRGLSSGQRDEVRGG